MGKKFLRFFKSRESKKIDIISQHDISLYIFSYVIYPYIMCYKYIM